MNTQITANIIKMILEDAFFLILKDYIIDCKPTLEWIESLDNEMKNRNNKMPKEIAQLLLYVTEIIKSGKTYSIFTKMFYDDSKMLYNLEYNDKEIVLTNTKDSEILKDENTISEIMTKNLTHNNVKILMNGFLLSNQFKTINDIRIFLLNKYSL